jgi:hypothetical protein
MKSETLAVAVLLAEECQSKNSYVGMGCLLATAPPNELVEAFRC